MVERRPKPPRQNRTGLPPVAERSRRSVGRPSVPPPDRPASFCKSESVSSESPDPFPKSESLCSDPDVLDPEDISISFDSSESESYNECQMSFSDNEDIVDKVEDSHCNGKMTGGEDRIDGHYNGKTTEGKVMEGRIAEVMAKGKVVGRYSNGRQAVQREEFDDYGVREREMVSSYADGKTVKMDGNTNLNGGKIKSCLVVSNRSNGSTPREDVDDDTRRNCKVVEHYSNGRAEVDYPQDKTAEDPGDIHDGSKIDERLSNGGQLKRPIRAHISWDDHKNSNFEHERLNSGSTCDEDVDDLDNTCHFTGGTPTWFDHYGDDKRQSNTLWFRNNEPDCTDDLLEGQEGYNRSSTLCSIEEDTSLGENYRTVIDVGSESKISYRSTVSGMAIKLRVNSETQDTRL